MQRHPQVKWVVTIPLPGGGMRLACEVCKAQIDAYVQHDADRFVGQHANHQSADPRYYGLGDAVERVTHALGLQRCTPCEERRRAMNQLAPRIWKR